MKTSFIYHSYSGNTRSVAERVSASCGGTLIEVKPRENYSTLTAYTIGCYRAMKGLCDPIEPVEIDVSSDDMIVIGTPVWAGKATPPINAVVEALRGCKGKKAVIFATSGGQERNTLPILKKALEAKGVTVIGEFVFDKKGLKDQDRINEMITKIRSASQ
jgi:flavodoxin